jgi:hypothetical protein
VRVARCLSKAAARAARRAAALLLPAAVARALRALVLRVRVHLGVLQQEPLRCRAVPAGVEAGQAARARPLALEPLVLPVPADLKRLVRAAEEPAALVEAAAAEDAVGRWW